MEARGRKEREGWVLRFEGLLKEEMIGKEREGTLVVAIHLSLSLSLALISLLAVRRIKARGLARETGKGGVWGWELWWWWMNYLHTL